jgi:hypothetical protein
MGRDYDPEVSAVRLANGAAAPDVASAGAVEG